MKMVSFTIEVPEWVEKFYKRQAKQRTISRTAVIRTVLIEHVKQNTQALPDAVLQEGGGK